MMMVMHNLSPLSELTSFPMKEVLKHSHFR